MAVAKKAPVEDAKPVKLVNIVINGQLRHKHAEVLKEDGTGLTIRTDPNSLSRCEVTLIPWGCIEGVGYIGDR